MENKIDNPQVEAQRQQIVAAREKGVLPMLGTFAKFSGPGWMQSATTLGGGSLASALYLGVLGGFGFMWLQPFAMVLGVVMLGAISYVTLSMNSRPMVEVNKQISPLLGYGWCLGSLVACLVFAWPQFALGVAAVTQNLTVWPGEPSVFAEVVITAIFFAVAMSMVIMYSVGGKGVKFFERIIKLSVAAIVICFFGVVIALTATGEIEWSRVFAGFVPNFSVLSKPSADFMKYIDELSAGGREFWSAMIVSQQRDVVISAGAMAVGINMTFLLPYSMLKKGWNKDFRGLAIFDLATGLFIPFCLATACIVIASASQFHAKPAKGLSLGSMYGGEFIPAKVEGVELVPAKNLVKGYIDLLDMRICSLENIDMPTFKNQSVEAQDKARNALDIKEREMAAMLVKRDASNLSETLEPLLGETAARYIFGLGVLGMAINAVLMNMLICGLCFAEALGKKGAKWNIAGSMLIIFSATASIFFKGARMWLVIYAGVIAAVLLPIAYGAFFLIMNNRRMLKDSMPRGALRAVWNVLMICSLAGSLIASIWVLYSKIGIYGPLLLVAFLAIIAVSYVMKNKSAANK